MRTFLSKHKVTVKIEWQEFEEMGLTKLIRKVLFPCGIYLLAALTVLMNVRLMFDNVLWGDECFSANTANNSIAGILQIMYFWDNHPPLHYIWLKLFGDCLGHSGPVYHLASLTPYMAGVVLAVTLLRKRFGSIPASFFIILTGLASPCLQYNLEIRMYSLAFFGVACSYYCAYRILSGGKLAWFALVFWALVAAYSHYYAMMCVGILMFITYVAAGVRYKGKTWIKGIVSMAAFLAGYAPWLRYLFHATDNVSHSWWMTELMGLRDSVQMILCGPELQKIIFLLLIVCLAVMFLAESSLFAAVKKEEKTEIHVHRPRLKDWSDETYAAAVGVLTIGGTLAAAYVLCMIVGPVLAQRYLYPISAITVLLLVIVGSRNLALIQKCGEKVGKNWLGKAGKCLFVVVLAVLLLIGTKNYRVYSARVKAEQAATEETLALIGEVSPDTKLVSNNVKHLAWTVLYYYYPERDIVSGGCDNEEIVGSNFWYFTPTPISEEQVAAMQERGYLEIGGYGEHQIATYTFYLYYFGNGVS